MALGSASPRPAEAGWGPRSSSDEMHRFLHAAHLLGALLREILEDKFLDGACPQRLNRVQFCCLKLVVVAPGIQVGEVSRRLGLSPASGSKNVEQLVQLGLLHRQGAEHDRRAAVLRATEAGERLVQDYERLKADHLDPVLAGLGAARKEDLYQLLETICGQLAEGMGPLRDPCFRCAGYREVGCPVAVIRGRCALRPAAGPT